MASSALQQWTASPTKEGYQLTSWWRKLSVMTVGQSSLISLTTSSTTDIHKLLWLDLQSVDIKSRWRHNWKSAQVVNTHLVCDPTIQQPGFDLPWQQWSLLNRFCTEQGHCSACKRNWRLTVSLRRDPDDVARCQILSCDKAEWLIPATLCRWRCCFLADQLRFVTYIQKEDEECPTRHIIGHFKGGSFRAINCTATNNHTHTNTRNYTKMHDTQKRKIDDDDDYDAGRRIRYGVTLRLWQRCTTSVCSWRHTMWYWLKWRLACHASLAMRTSCAASSKRVSAGMSRNSTCCWNRSMILLRYDWMDSPCSDFFIKHFYTKNYD